MSVAARASAQLRSALSSDDVAEAMAALAATYSRGTEVAGTCVADGFGLRIVVERGSLEVHDGVGPHRRTRRYDKATHGLSRLVVMNSSGIVSLDALRWCAGLGIGVVILGSDGTAQLASTPRAVDDARLRRAQALSGSGAVGLDIARWLLAAKLAGQAALLATRFDDTGAAATITELCDGLGHVSSVEEARQLEASAAAIYFGSWAGRAECVPRFVARDAKRIPPHWLRYDGRRSVLASVNANRKAERPVNALLNYVFALLETEAVLACAAVGLDAGLGVVHADSRGRDSLALDLIEPLRPEAEGLVLDIIGSRTFRRSDFTETPEGHVRLMAPLTHELAATLPRWRSAVAPVAEHLAHVLGAVIAGKFSPATPLTRSRAKAAQAQLRARRLAASERATKQTTHQRPVGEPVLPFYSCPDCAALVTNPRHVRCESCIAKDPAQARPIRASRGRAIAARKQALLAWEKAHPGVCYDPELFARDILPRLRSVKLAEIMAAAGISKGYASEVRSGTYTPHISTWSALAALVGVEIGDERAHSRA